MLRHPSEQDFHFHFEDDPVHYHVPALTNHNLYWTLIELELASSIIDILQLSQNHPEKRLIAAFRHAKQLLSEIPGLRGSDKERLEEVKTQIDFCDTPDVYNCSTENDYIRCLADAANNLTDIMQHTFFSDEETEEVFGDVLLEHVMLRHNPEFKKLMDSIN